MGERIQVFGGSRFYFPFLDDLSQAKVAVIFTVTRPTLCRRNDNKSVNCCGKVHVEQQIQRVKCFQICSQPLSLKMAVSLNQMLTVLANVCNLQKPNYNQKIYGLFQNFGHPDHKIP